MKQFFIICASIIALIVASCDKNDAPDNPNSDQWEVNDSTEIVDSLILICGGPTPYAIGYNVGAMGPAFWTGADGVTSGWMDEQSDWDPKNPGPYDSIFVSTTFRGGWQINLGSEGCSLTRNKEKYVQLCLEWGVRMDNNEEECPELADLPNVKPMLPPFFITDHGIIGMDLVTERDFDVDHPAGSSLADITKIAFFSVEPCFQKIADPSKQIDYVNEYQRIVCMRDIDAYTLPRIEPQFNTLITKNPQQAGTYVFRQYIYLANGKVIETRFKRVWLERHLALDPMEKDPEKRF